MKSFELEKFKVQGIKINYYYVCKRKLWLFDKGITMEHMNDKVLQGKVLHETAYSRKKAREFLIDDLIKIDIADADYIREVKMSSKMKLADKMQIAYYLYYLKKEKGIIKKGTINYTKERKVEEIELNTELENEIEKTLIEIEKIISKPIPPQLEKLPYCRKCAYFEFCFVGGNE